MCRTDESKGIIVLMKPALKNKKIRVFAPATVANVGSGFDIFGFALHTPGDEVFLRITDKRGVEIKNIVSEFDDLPYDATKNTAAVSVGAMLKFLRADFGVSLNLHKKMPIGSGLGSSAASSVASVYALNCLLENPLSKEEILNFAIAGEKITSGESVHLDNIAACLFGGFRLVRSRNPFDIISIPTPDDLYCTIIHPRINIKTAESRKLLKKQIPLDIAVTQWGNVAGMIAALFKKDYDLLSRSLKDVVAEPVRSILIPYFEELSSRALKAGALGCSISGSGPSVFALSNSHNKAQFVGEALKRVLDGHEVENDLYISKINEEGPKVIEVG
jgi:homoserine kinase